MLIFPLYYPSNWSVPTGAPFILFSLSWCPSEPCRELEEIRELIRYCVVCKLPVNPTEGPTPLTSTKSFCIIICITCLQSKVTRLFRPYSVLLQSASVKLGEIMVFKSQMCFCRDTQRSCFLLCGFVVAFFVVFT